MPPQTQYAKGPGGHVAYQVFGDGPLDIVFVPDHPSNIEIMWEEPTLARFLTRLASIGRVVCFDKRGAGLSDPIPLGALPTLEQLIDDITTVMDAASSDRAVVLGHGDGGPMSIVFAATYPHRTAALILADTYARLLEAPDYPCGISQEKAERRYRRVVEAWGKGEGLPTAPGMSANPAFREWRGRYERHSLSPGAVAAMYRVMAMECDVRSVLPAIRVPTLVLHRAAMRFVPVALGRYVAESVRGAKYLELPGDDYFFHLGDTDAFLGAVEEFLTGKTNVDIADEDRVLATVMFTDIVDSTERASELGDRAWRDLLERHHAVIRREIERHRGREIKTTGDGFVAAFDGPARGVRCALAIRDAVRGLGLEVRAGLHTGECERMGDDMGGIALHIGARVAATAEPGEVRVSRTVKDLVAGSGLRFADRGTHGLKGVDGEWQLYAAE